MCGSRFVPTCPLCGNPLPGVTMAHTAAGVAPVHHCLRLSLDNAETQQLVFPNTLQTFAAVAAAAPFAGQIIGWRL